jgi:biotin transport system substrate-specific component
VNNSLKINCLHFLKPILGVAILAVFSQISLKIGGENPIPITGQSFALLLVGYFLGKKWGVVSVLFYLILGGLGCPFFADGACGWAIFQKGSAGFLLGFLPTIWLVGFLREKWPSRNFFSILKIFSLATLLLLFFGNAWLMARFGFQKGLNFGFWPILPGAILKVFAATIFVFLTKKMS